jgi:signal transduction histidine kinase
MMTQFVGHELSNVLQGMKVETKNIEEKTDEIEEMFRQRINKEREFLDLLDELIHYLRFYVEGSARNNELLYLLTGMTDSSLLDRAPERESFYPNEVLGHITNSFTDMFADRNKSIQKPKNIRNLHRNTKIFADEKMFRLIAHNLYSNALKYSHYNTVTIADSFYIPHDKIYRLIITSYGQYLTDKMCTRIFDVGYRTDEAKNAAMGMGIGLFLVKHFTESHKGWAYATSTKLCDYHTSCLRTYITYKKDFSGLFLPHEVKKLEYAYDEFKSNCPDHYRDSFHRTDQLKNPSYIKRLINNPTACNQFVVDFPQP